MSNDDVSKYIEDHKDLATGSDVDSYIADHTPKTAGHALLDQIKGAIPTGDAIAQAGKAAAANLTDTLKGYTSGAVLNGESELGGGVQALLDKMQQGTHALGLTGESPTQVNAHMKDMGFTGDIGPTDDTQLYRQGQQETAKDFKQSEDRSPWLYTGGQIGGAVTSGLALGAGAGLAADATGLTKVAGTAGKALAGLAPEAAEYVSEGSGLIPKGIRLAGKAAKMAAVAAPEGFAMGSLGSDHDIIGATNDEAEKNLADGVGGAETASVLGGGISLASHIVPPVAGKISQAVKDWASNYIKDSPALRVQKLAFDKGMEGLNPTSEKAILEGTPEQGPLSQFESGKSAEWVNKINAVDDMLGKDVGESLVTSTKTGTKIDITDEATDLAKNIQKFALQNDDVFDPKDIRTLSNLYPGKGVLTPIEAKSAIDEAQALIDKMAGDTSLRTNALREQAIQLKGIITSQLKDQVPEYAQAAQRFAQFRSEVPETILRGRIDGDFNNATYGGMKNGEKNLQQSLSELIAGVSHPGTATSKAKEVFSNLSDSLGRLSQSEGQRLANGQIENGADVFSKLGQTKEQILQSLKDQGDFSAMKNMSNQVNSNEGRGAAFQRGTFGVVNTGRAALVNSANMAGRAVKLGSDIIKGAGGLAGEASASPVNVGKQLYNMVPEELMGIAKRFQNDPTRKAIGESLENAIQNNDIPKKNAILFSIMQNPHLRLGLSGNDLDNKGTP
jgi:hypothetical protein